MEVVVIESKAFNEIIKKIDEIEIKVEKAVSKTLNKEEWLDVSEVCDVLKVSKRTLQNYRDTGILGFSKYGGKVYFKAKEIKEYFERNYVKPTVKW
jgi:excisionase family DNA binding protein